LPEWFGVEASIAEYVDGVRDKPFYGVFDGDKAVGFVAIKVHSAHTAEVYVMGLKKAYHWRGFGKKLIRVCEDYCRWHSMIFLTVKTLAATVNNKHYARTRGFYENMGFKTLEVFPLHWDAANPCLFMAKYVKD